MGSGKMVLMLFVLFMSISSVSALYNDYYYNDYSPSGTYYQPQPYYSDAFNYYYNDYQPSVSFRTDWGNRIYNSRGNNRYYLGSSNRYYYDDPSAYLGYRTFTYGDPYERGNFHYGGRYRYDDSYGCGFYYCRMSYYGRSYY